MIGPRAANDEQTRARMQELGVTDADLDCLCDEFVGHPFGYASKMPGQEGWTHWPYTMGLDTGRLLDHLTGSRWFGTNARADIARKRRWTPCVVFDLDAHGDTYPIDRLDEVRRIFGPPSFVFLTPSGGYHVYYFLTEPCELYTLRSDDGVRGLVLDMLRAAGMPEDRGTVEVYPRGSTDWRGVQNPLRLPFGAGCRLIDPVDYNPLVGRGPRSGIESLRAVRAQFETGEVARACVSEWRRWLADSTPAPAALQGPVGGKAPARRVSSGRAALRPETERWRTAGLDGPGQLHVAAWNIALAMWLEWRSEEDTRDFLQEWIDWPVNRANSQTRQRSQRAAYAKIEDRIAWVFRDGPRQGRRWVPRPALSAFEADRIVSATHRPGDFADPDTGEVLPRFKVQLYAVHAHQAAKQFLLTRALEVLQGVSPRVALKMARPWWPDPSRPEFVVSLPYTHRVQWPGIGKPLVPALGRIVAQLGLVVPTDERVGKGGSCTRFRIALDFGALSASPVVYTDLESMLAEQLSTKDLRAPYYTRRYADRIHERAAEVGPPNLVPHLGPLSSLESLAWAHLGASQMAYTVAA